MNCGHLAAMLLIRILLLCALLCGCDRTAAHDEQKRITDPKKLALLREEFVPEAYVRPEDRRRAERLRAGYQGPMPCAYEKTEMGTRVIAPVRVDQCFKMTGPQRWKGLWRDDFESSQFCAAPDTRCETTDRARFVWLDLAVDLPGAKDTPPGGLYAIDFIGRKTAYPGLYDGTASQEIVVDRLISIRMVKPPPPGQMTKEHIKGYLEDCAGAKICMPNSEVPRRS